jgi:hypothetical protein
MLSFLPDRDTGFLKIGIGEHPYSYRYQLGALLGFPENRSPAFRTEVECHSPTTVRSTRISFGDALSEPDLRSRIERLNTKSASCPALAFEAVAHGDADGVASNRYLELSATACGFAIRHVDDLSTRTMGFVLARSFWYLKTPKASGGRNRKTFSAAHADRHRRLCEVSPQTKALSDARSLAFIGFNSRPLGGSRKSCRLRSCRLPSQRCRAIRWFG